MYYLISYDPSFKNDILEDRIKRLGEYYKLFDNQYIIKVENHLKSSDIYKSISKENFTLLKIFVTELGNSYGYMLTSLWDFLKQKQNERNFS